MKKIIILVGCVFSVVLINAQSLTIPASLNNWGDAYTDNMAIEFTNWIGDNALTPLSDSETKFIIDISKWNPEPSELGEIRISGGDTENYPWFVQCDSTFFSDTVISEVAKNNYDKIIGRSNLERMTWGEFYDAGDEVYYNPNIDRYFVKMVKIVNNIDVLMTLQEVWVVRANADGVTGLRPAAYVYNFVNSGTLIRINQW